MDTDEPVELAEKMIRLAGMKIRSDTEPDDDIEIVVTGKRPSEEMYQELFYGSDATTTRHPRL